MGFVSVVGVDEVGRGCLAGPVVAAAVCFVPGHQPIKGVNDSKQLSATQRLQLDMLIRKSTYMVGIGEVQASQIDEVGIVKATAMAMREACLVCSPQIIYVDGPSELGLDSLCSSVHAVPHGDTLIYSIAAASIVAKVYRDALMADLACQHPDYQWDQNKGYGTKAHIQAIRQHGLTPFHRKSFKYR